MRAAGILVFCLFSSILSTVTSLECQRCVAFGTDCNKESVKVLVCNEDQEFCSTVVLNNTISDIPLILTVKNCATRDECMYGLFSTATVDSRFETGRANCCQTDLCNEQPLPLENYEVLQPNGLQCPGCFALDEDSCEANQTVACVSNQDQCLTITSTTEAVLPPFANFTQKLTYQGCTTKNSCSFPLGYSEIADGLVHFNVTTMECRNASPSEPDHQ